MTNQTLFETHGIEPIPESDRHSTIFDFIRLCWGGANSLATATLGSLPIAFGLSLHEAVAADFVGVLVGSCVLAPMALFGPLTGTNNSVASGAHFGVAGRLIGSGLSLLTAIAFFALSVWSSGDAAVGTVHVLTGGSGSKLIAAIAYGLFSAAILTVCIYGFRLMLLVSKIAVVASSLVFALGLASVWTQVDLSYCGLQNSCTPHWFSGIFLNSCIIAAANPISFGAFLGDWTRYLPKATPRRQLLVATILAQLLALLPLLFGTVTASLIAVRHPHYILDGDFAGGLLETVPGWFLLPLFVLATVSGMSTGTTSLYGTGLDFSSLIPRLSRPRATLLIGLAATTLIFLGRFLFSVVSTVTTFTTLIVVTTTPWIVILTIGFARRRGYYRAEALLTFTRREEKGPYWYWHGWNRPAIAAWTISSAIALACANIPGHFVGYVAAAWNTDYDFSLIVAISLSAALYLLFLWIFPEPVAVFEPLGTAFGPTDTKTSASDLRGLAEKVDK